MMALAEFLRGSQEITISGTTSLWVGAPYVNVISATSTGFRVRLPDATKLRRGARQFWIANAGANAFTVRDGANVDLLVMNPGDCADFHLLLNSTAAGLWKWEARTINSAASPALSILAYFIGGQTGGGSSANAKKTSEYSPQTNAWISKTDSATSWVMSSSFVIGAHGYILNSEGASTAIERYDPDVHTAETAMPSTGIGSGFGCACSLSGNGYMQSNGTKVLSYNEAGDSWTTLANRGPNEGTGESGWVALDPGIGYDFQSGVTPVNRTDAFTAATTSWAQKTTRPGPKAYGIGNTALNGLGYTFCGWNGTLSTIIKDTYEYTPGSDSWIRRIDWPTNPKIVWVNAVPIQNRAYAMGGILGDSGGNASFANWEYDPLAIVWTQKADIINSPAKVQNHGMPITV